jgi:hypothetical protein
MTTLMATTAPLLRRTVLAGVISGIGLLAAAVRANAQPALVDLQVIDRETGQAAKVWRTGGRSFVAGRPGARYSLRVTNNSPGRVLVVMSVDGVNILTGETAAFGQRGYVFAPYETYDVSGWRKSDTEVAAFNFAPLPRSYAARTGRPDDVGVIGIAAFTERYVAPKSAQVAPRPAPQLQGRDAETEVEESVVTGALRRRDGASDSSAAARAAPFAGAPPRSEKLGTGHGAREWSSVTTVAFERATSYPQLVSRIEYDSTENLIAIGVIPPPRPGLPTKPRPFPANPGYVPDPPYGR